MTQLHVVSYWVGRWVFYVKSGDNEEDDKFDMIVGALEDIMMDDEFQELQSNFAAEHCNHFEATDEVLSVFLSFLVLEYA